MGVMRFLFDPLSVLERFWAAKGSDLIPEHARRSNRVVWVVTVEFNVFLYIYIMNVTTYSNFRQHLKKFLDGITVNHNPLFVKRYKV